MFALNGKDFSKTYKLIRGTCFINDIPLIDIIDKGVTRSFISVKCVKRLNLVVSIMNGSMVIDTSTNGSMTTSLVCLNFHLTVYGKEFDIDLVYVPLSHIDVIPGMNWLEFNRVHIIRYDKSMLFLDFVEEEYSKFISASQGEEFLKYEAHVFAMFASLKVESKAEIVYLPVVCEFPDVFLDDITDIPPETEIEFSIDLVPGIRPMSTAPYMISMLELGELKSQLEDLLENKFVRPSVSS